MQIYPVIDRRLKVDSKRRNGERYLISATALECFWDHYLSKPSDVESPLASPLNAKSLAALAPALILAAEFDPSCDEAIEYVKALKAAGTDVSRRGARRQAITRDDPGGVPIHRGKSADRSADRASLLSILDDPALATASRP